MKIAVTSENNQVFQHFGHTREFSVFEIIDGRMSAMQAVKPTGDGHAALAQFLNAISVDLLICGGIGGCAQKALFEAGVKLIGGAEGDVVKVVGDYLKGELKTRSNFSCEHHHEGGECGHHGK